MAVNWVKIRNEYITTTVSQRKLAEKYKVDKTTIARKCKEQNWVALRKENECKRQARCEQKTIEKIAEKESQQLVDGLALLNNMLSDITVFREKISEAVNGLDMEKPEKTIIKSSDTVRMIKKEKSGIDKVEKLAMSISRLAKTVYDAVEVQKKYNDKEEYDDDGLLEALAKSVEDMTDDIEMLPEEDDES